MPIPTQATEPSGLRAGGWPVAPAHPPPRPTPMRQGQAASGTGSLGLALGGMLGMASALGIGRFVYTAATRAGPSRC